MAGDYCVKHTAIDAAKSGFKTFVVTDCVKSVDESEGGEWEEAKKELEERWGVKCVGLKGEEVGWVEKKGKW